MNFALAAIALTISCLTAVGAWYSRRLIVDRIAFLRRDIEAIERQLKE